MENIANLCWQISQLGHEKKVPIQRKELEGNADDAEKKERKSGSGSLPKRQVTPTIKTMKYLGKIIDKKN